MKTNINLNVLFPLNMENNIHEFEFFTKFGQPTDNIDISIYVVPRYSIDEQKVRNIKTTYLLDRAIESGEIFGILGILKELQNTTPTVIDRRQRAMNSITHCINYIILKPKIQEHLYNTVRC